MTLVVFFLLCFVCLFGCFLLYREVKIESFTLGQSQSLEREFRVWEAGTSCNMGTESLEQSAERSKIICVN